MSKILPSVLGHIPIVKMQNNKYFKIHSGYGSNDRFYVKGYYTTAELLCYPTETVYNDAPTIDAF